VCFHEFSRRTPLLLPLTRIQEKRRSAVDEAATRVTDSGMNTISRGQSFDALIVGNHRHAECESFKNLYFHATAVIGRIQKYIDIQEMRDNIGYILLDRHIG
jgi:hypothetical protein